jgi:hypothetical protein
MKSIIMLSLSRCSALMLGNAALAEEASVTISAPADGAKMDGMEPCAVEYAMVPGPHGDHVHLYVDGEEVAVLRKLAGSYTLASLDPGQRELCIKIVNKGHTPIGVVKCISVTVE